MKIVIDTGVKYCPYCKYRLFDIDLILGICGNCYESLPLRKILMYS